MIWPSSRMQKIIQGVVLGFGTMTTESSTYMAIWPDCFRHFKDSYNIRKAPTMLSTVQLVDLTNE
jgi:hypothetical protein